MGLIIDLIKLQKAKSELKKVYNMTGHTEEEFQEAWRGIKREVDKEHREKESREWDRQEQNECCTFCTHCGVLDRHNIHASSCYCNYFDEVIDNPTRTHCNAFRKD